MRKRLKEGTKKAGKYCKKGIVFTITSDKVINAVMNGSFVAFVLSINEGVSKYIQIWTNGITGYFVPVKIIASVGALGTFVLAFYADRNTEEWRDKVRDISKGDKDVEEAIDEAEEESEEDG